MSNQEPTVADSYRPWWHRLPVSILLSVVFFIGAYRISVTDNGLDGIVLVVLSVFMVGVWVTVELHDVFFGRHSKNYTICPDPSAHIEEGG